MWGPTPACFWPVPRWAAGVYENIDDARIKKGVREKLLRDKEQAGMSRTLAEIVCSAPVNAAPGAYKKDAPDAPAAARLLTET